MKKTDVREIDDLSELIALDRSYEDAMKIGNC